MKVQCKNCLPKEGIEVPDFDQLEKGKIVELASEPPLRATKYLLEWFNLNHLEAKYIVTHINMPYGHCNRCNFDQLHEEYMTCPKCRALNFNWKTH